ncbi:MAG: DNA polymerase III subunit gamma/tau [Defluviitaleaceae bacterium]|nr:DNA polymerase III subunit gamma/tau [Defluviitaleaceae bacterium]
MHTALYRKKRPKTFADLVGQPHVVQALTNQLETGQLSHAYLFCGTRGTGKTSAAKIFARAVNCPTPQADGPCNTCELCQSILADRCMDVIEIDAASNNSVDNIRDLREEVRYPPTEATHKVYIIDEVHMLSTSAFNALLKTLEEPPSHVIFILATTDPQKIPATILSRCQRYDFKRITATDMVETMVRYLQGENTSYEDAALEQIAYHSDGAMRDALSLLDQCLAMGEGGIVLANVLQLLGAVDRTVLFDFTDALGAYDSARILQLIDGAMVEGRDVTQMTNNLVRHFRDVLVAGQGAELDYSVQITEKLKEQGARLPGGKLIEYICAFSETLRELRFAPHMRTALEVCALRLCSPQVTTAGGSGPELDGLVARLAKVERKLAEGAVIAQPPSHTQEISPLPHTPTTVIPGSTREPLHSGKNEGGPAQGRDDGNTGDDEGYRAGGGSSLTPQFLSQIQTDWRSLCNVLPPLVRSMLIRCSLEAEGGTLKIICDNASEAKLLKDKNRPHLIREALAERFNLDTPPNLDFLVQETKEIPTAKEPMPVFTSPPPSEPEPEQFIPPMPEQMGWDDYGQATDEDTESPF